MAIKKCSFADRYQAKYPPRCGCEACEKKWEAKLETLGAKPKTAQEKRLH